MKSWLTGPQGRRLSPSTVTEEETTKCKMSTPQGRHRRKDFRRRGVHLSPISGFLANAVTWPFTRAPSSPQKLFHFHSFFYFFFSFTAPSCSRAAYHFQCSSRPVEILSSVPQGSFSNVQFLGVPKWLTDSLALEKFGSPLADDTGRGWRLRNEPRRLHVICVINDKARKQLIFHNLSVFQHQHIKHWQQHDNSICRLIRSVPGGKWTNISLPGTPQMFQAARPWNKHIKHGQIRVHLRLDPRVPGKKVKTFFSTNQLDVFQSRPLNRKFTCPLTAITSIVFQWQFPPNSFVTVAKRQSKVLTFQTSGTGKQPQGSQRGVHFRPAWRHGKWRDAASSISHWNSQSLTTQL